MCEFTAYLNETGPEGLIMESVEKIEPHGDGILLTNIFGEQKALEARFYSLAENTILLKSNSNSETPCI